MQRLLLGILIGSLSWGIASDDLMDLSLNELLAMDVEVASKNSESIWEAPGVVTVMNRQEIEQFGATNLTDLLNRVTSMVMLNTYFSSNNFASVRGDTQSHYNNHTLVLLNGRPIRDSEFGSFMTVIFQSFPIMALERVEIIRGPGSVLYGAGAFSGVINLVTRKAETVNQFEMSAGSFDRQAASILHGGTSNGLGYLIAAISEGQDGQSRMAFDEGGQPQNLAYGEAANGIFGNVTLGNWSVEALAIRSTFDYWGTSPNGPGVERDMARYYGNLGWERLFGNLNVEANLTYNELKSYEGAENGSQDLLLELTGFYAVNEQIDLTFGALTENQSGGWEGLIPSYDLQQSSLYFQASYRPHPQWKFIGGGQYNRPDSGESDFVPRLGIISRFSDKAGIKVLYGEAFRSPAAIETQVQSPPILIGNPNLEPEKVATTEIQAYYDTGPFQTAATLFHTQQEQLIGRELVAGPTPFFSYANLGSGTFEGIEWESKYAPNERLFTTLAVTYQENENQDGVQGFTTMPSLTAKAGFVARVGKAWNVGLFDSYFSKPRGVERTNPNVMDLNPPSKAFHLVSLNLEYSFRRNNGKGISVNLFTQNLLDESIYQPELARRLINTIPGSPGRSVTGRLTWSF